MKHHRRLLAALVIFAVVLSACAGQTPAAPTPEPPTATPEPPTATPEPPPTSAPETTTEKSAASESQPASEAAASEQPSAEAIYMQSPWWPWLSAHMMNEDPPAIVGGPISLHGVQALGGAANFLLPGPRALDPIIFGTADAPQATEPPAVALGMPIAARATLDDGTQATAGPSPFGNKVATVPGDISLTLVDATAMDGGTTADVVDVEATFGSPNGEDTYRVVVKKAAAHGMFIPTGGGVVTNFMQHGVTGWGTRLMPTLYSYVSFWGMGNIYKNDELIAEGRVVHGMQTEFVRKAPYDLAFDNEVDPNASQFHLMIAPITPKGDPSPVPTGFTLPNGMEQPFFHVMYPTVAWSAEVNGEAVGPQEDLPYVSPSMSPEMMAMAQAEDAPYKQSLWWPWLSAHVQNENPPQLLTGPIEVTLKQDEGAAANFLLPGPRMLDPTVFGTADAPKGMDMPPIVMGVPAAMRAEAPNGGQMTKGPTPFGNMVKTVPGSFEATLIDATAMDGARTQDSVDFTATFASPNGEDTYKVVVKMAAPHGWFNPTGGGVVTNFMQHGVTKWGTELMPTLYSYASFWGMGNIYKNDELIAEGRPVHGMLTEFVRKPPYDLAFDGEVNPNATHFHLMIPAVDPFGNPNPVPTGFTLPNGMEQPFFHVMFPVTQVEAHPLGTSAEAEDQGSTTETSAVSLDADASDAREIEIVAKEMKFNVQEITIKKGETVQFVAQSVGGDIFHTFTVKQDASDARFLFSLNLIPGQEAQTQSFTADEVGDFYFYCIPHEKLGMNGIIHVVE